MDEHVAMWNRNIITTNIASVRLLHFFKKVYKNKRVNSFWNTLYKLSFHHIYGGGGDKRCTKCTINLVVLLVNGGLGLWCRKILKLNARKTEIYWKKMILLLPKIFQILPLGHLGAQNKNLSQIRWLIWIQNQLRNLEDRTGPNFTFFSLKIRIWKWQ